MFMKYQNGTKTKQTHIVYSLTLSLLNTSVLKEKNIQFCFNSTSNLTHEILYDNFNKKILLNFLVKIIIQSSSVKFDAFSRGNNSFMSSKTRRLEAKVLKILYIKKII